MKAKHRSKKHTEIAKEPTISKTRTPDHRDHRVLARPAVPTERKRRPRLGDRQAMVLEFIRDFVARNPFPPTVREIGRGCHISSTSVVDYNLAVLEVEGYLTRIPNIARGIVLTKRGRSSLGITKVARDPKETSASR